MRNHTRGFFCVKTDSSWKCISSKSSSFTSYFLLPTSHRLIPYRVHAYLAWNLRRNAMTVVPVTTPYDVGHECDGETQNLCLYQQDTNWLPLHPQLQVQGSSSNKTDNSAPRHTICSHPSVIPRLLPATVVELLRRTTRWSQKYAFIDGTNNSDTSIPTPIYAARWLWGGTLISPNGEIIRSICDFNSLDNFCGRNLNHTSVLVQQ